MISQLVGGSGQEHYKEMLSVYHFPAVLLVSPEAYIFSFTPAAESSGFASNFIGYGIGDDEHPWDEGDCYDAIPAFVGSGEYANSGPTESGLIYKDITFI